ncbi:MAG: hypothetical protein B7Z52_00200 [Burkholderiales bacterium 12-64-5]|nr:MAG: hypothetical protein B7Z52_00200 [Burkholderiales bacterium 12-64-5]
MSKEVMTFEGLVAPGEPARTFSVVGAQFHPLGYEPLRTLTTPARLHLSWHGGEVIAGDISGSIGQIASGNFLIESHLACRAIGLVNGGWLPSSLATHNDTLVLPDRCVVSELRLRFKRGRTGMPREPDFIDLFADREVRINPLFFALEGNHRRIPTHPELAEQWHEAQTALEMALPQAKIIPINPTTLTGVLGMLNSSLAEFQREQIFLQRVAPSLVNPIPYNRRFERHAHLVAIADSLGVKNSSLALVAALSVIFFPNGASPAKRLLKVKPIYRAEDAYNALSDLRCLQILMHLFAMYPREKAMLCTTDRDLALFWVGLNASGFAANGRQMRYDLAPEALFPNLSVEELRNALRLA